MTACCEIDVGGGDDADVDLDFVGAAEMHEAAVLQDAQDLGLHVHAHGADFVEEERAAVGDFEEAFFRGDGGGERAALVAEERGFEQIGGDGAGVDGDEGLVAAGRVGVDGLGDELFAGAAFALDEDGGAAGRDLRDEVEEAEHGVAFADDVFEGVALLEGALEVDDFLLRRAERPMAARMSARSFSLSQGFWTKLAAPARMASTTLPTVP